MENLTDSQGAQAGTLTPKLKELLGRVSARHSSDAEVWQQYAMLYGGGRSSNPDDNDKVGFMLVLSLFKYFIAGFFLSVALFFVLNNWVSSFFWGFFLSLHSKNFVVRLKIKGL